MSGVKMALAVLARRDGMNRRDVAKLLGLAYNEDTRWFLDDVDEMVEELK